MKRSLSPALTALATLATLPDGSVKRADATPPVQRGTIARITAAPKAERVQLSPEARAELKLERKERRARRMKLRKHRGFR